MTNSSERIEQIRKRLEAATPGEWRAANTLVGSDETDAWLAQAYRPYGWDENQNRVFRGADRSVQNADLIANAPADLRWLLSRLERAEELLRDVIEFDCLGNVPHLRKQVAAYLEDANGQT